VNIGAQSLMGPAQLDGRVTIAASEARLEGATVKLDAGEGRLDLTFGAGNPKPRITGKVAWQELDLLRLVGETPVAPAAAAALEARARVPGPVIESAWQSLSADLANIEAASAGVTTRAAGQSAKEAAWSTQPLDLSALDAIDVAIESSANAVKYGRIDVRNSATSLTMKDGRLAWDLKSLEIAGGRAKGKLAIDGTQKPARVTVDATATDVPAESVLAQLFKSLLLSGKTSLAVGLEGRGRTPQELVSSLAGQADMRLVNGAFHGFDLRRSLLTWWQSHPFDPSKRTAVARIDGKFALADGVLRTAGPLTVDGDVRMSAEGTVRIAERAMDQNIRVRVAPPPEHLSVPVRVTGSWTQPKIAWDWRSIFESQGLLGSPLSVSSAAEPIPPEVKAAIARVLAGPGGQALSPDARQMLETLGGG
jgi:AsmA protein